MLQSGRSIVKDGRRWGAMFLAFAIALGPLATPASPCSNGKKCGHGSDDDDDCDNTGMAANMMGHWKAQKASLGHPGDAFNEGAVVSPIKHAPRPIIGAIREPLSRLPQYENFQLVGHLAINNPGQTLGRGRNGAVEIAPPYAYIGNRLGRRSGTGPNFGTPALPPEIAIVDISNPAAPTMAGWLQTPAGGSTREIRAMVDLNLLIVGNSAEDGSTNNFMFYNISNRANPVLQSTLNLGTWNPHEFFVWRDRKTANRTLLYVAGEHSEPWMRVWDITNASSGQVATQIATFSMTPAYGGIRSPNPPTPIYDPGYLKFSNTPANIQNTIHTMGLNEDGTRVYMEGRHSAFWVVDSSKLANNEPCIADNVTVDKTTNTNTSLCLRKINPDPFAGIDIKPPVPALGHDAVKVPNRPFVIISDERNGVNTCPWGWVQIIDVTVEAHPIIASYAMLPENLKANCYLGGPGDPTLMREFSPHQATAFENLFFITWYSGGLRAWDISNAYLPLETGVFAPKPEPALVETFRDSRDLWAWSFPIVYNGLIYYVDDNNGLYIARYTGDRADEVPQTGIHGGNAVR